MVLAAAAIASLGITGAQAANISSAASGNWNAGGTWVGGVPPVAGDNVTIASGHVVTVTANAAAATITVAANAGASNGITINAGILLNVSGAITMTSPTVASTSTINVGAGSLNAASVAIPGSATAGRICLVTVSSGTITVSGSITFSGTASRAQFTSTGASTVNVGGSFGAGGTLTTSGTGTINFNGGAAQTIGAYATYNNVAINNTAGGVTLGGTSTFGGTLTVTTGTFTVGAFSLTVTGATSVSGTLTVSGTPGTKTFGDLTINNGGLMNFTAAENVTENGNLQVDGSIAGSSGTWTFQKAGGGGTLSGSAASTTLSTIRFTTAYAVSGTWVVSNTLTVTGTTLTNNGTLTATAALSGTGGLTQGANATLNLGGTSGITTLTATANDNTVNYSGAAQTVKSTPYFHLTLSGSGAKTMPGATLTISGNFTMSGTCTATAAAAVNTAGNFTIGGSNTFTAGAFTHDIKGNLTASGTFTTTNSTITLTGPGGQSLDGSTLTFNNLTVNKSTGTVNLVIPITVNGVLTFTSGNISTGLNNASLAAAGSVSRTSGHVVGNLRKNVAAGANVARTFEVGDATNYTPANLVFASVSVSGTMTVSTTAGDHPNIATSDINPSKSVNRYWTLATAGLTYTTYSATYNFVVGDVDAGANTATFVVRRWSGAAWSNTTIGARTGTSTQITGQSTTGDFQCGNVLSVLASNSVFAFGTQPLNTWLTPQSSLITNDGTEAETIVAKISTFTAGASTWALSAAGNGADQVRAQWSTTSSSGPWNDISAYVTDFTVASGLAAGSNVTLYFRIQSPTSTASLAQYASTLTVTAQ
jgi:hypothetical protein